MRTKITTILFDMGGTLRYNLPRTQSEKDARLQHLADLLGLSLSPQALNNLLKERQDAYQTWARENLLELDEARLWTEWLMPDQPSEMIAEMAVELNQAWRDVHWMRIPYDETGLVVLELFRRGYRLGLVSNTTSSVEVPALLEAEGISGCFETVILSCQVGMRKPGKEILLEAVRRMEVEPQECAYIGDRLERDVDSSRQAGFGRVFILRDPRSSFKAAAFHEHNPDGLISNLKELLVLFPDLHHHPQNRQRTVDLSISTIWGMKKFADLNDFLLAAVRLGIPKVELNHQVTPDRLAKLDLSFMPVSSVHEPCPAQFTSAEMRKMDVLISSPDEIRRQKAVETVKGSIDLAARLKAHTVVVHCGQVQMDSGYEKELRALFNQGQGQASQSVQLRDKMVQFRAELAETHLQAVKRSLRELLEYARPRKVRLAVENRYHHYDIPTLDEMGDLLELGSPPDLGFLYDVGHAQTLDRLGFFPHDAWRERFASRIFGVHLHDVSGVADHFAPGLGEVDYGKVAACLPADAFRVLEVYPFNSPEQIRNGLTLLVETGCIKTIV